MSQGCKQVGAADVTQCSAAEQHAFWLQFLPLEPCCLQTGLRPQLVYAMHERSPVQHSSEWFVRLLSPCTQRFWHDEKRFRGSGDASLAQHVLFAAGGTRVGGNFKAAKAQGPMGWQVPDR